MKPLISVISVNYNGYGLTCAMVESLQRHVTTPLEIIVVDNGSARDEAAMLRECYPEIKALRSDHDLNQTQVARAIHVAQTTATWGSPEATTWGSQPRQAITCCCSTTTPRSKTIRCITSAKPWRATPQSAPYARRSGFSHPRGISSSPGIRP